MIDVTLNGVVGNGNDVYGQVQEIVDKAPEGSTIYFPSTTTANGLIEYGFSQPVLLTKSMHILGDSSDVTIRARGNNTLFRIEPSRENMVFSFEDFQLMSGNIAIDISSSFDTCHCSKISNVRFQNQENAGIKFYGRQLNFEVSSCYFDGQEYGMILSSTNHYNDFHVERSTFRNTATSSIRIDKAQVEASGSIDILNNTFLDCSNAISLNHVTGTIRENSFINCINNIVYSGSARNTNTLISLAQLRLGSGSIAPAIVQGGNTSAYIMEINDALFFEHPINKDRIDRGGTIQIHVDIAPAGSESGKDAAFILDISGQKKGKSLLALDLALTKSFSLGDTIAIYDSVSFDIPNYIFSGSEIEEVHCKLYRSSSANPPVADLAIHHISIEESLR